MFSLKNFTVDIVFSKTNLTLFISLFFILLILSVLEVMSQYKNENKKFNKNFFKDSFVEIKRSIKFFFICSLVVIFLAYFIFFSRQFFDKYISYHIEEYGMIFQCTVIFVYIYLNIVIFSSIIALFFTILKGLITYLNKNQEKVIKNFMSYLEIEEKINKVKSNKTFNQYLLETYVTYFFYLIKTIIKVGLLILTIISISIAIFLGVYKMLGGF